jgi:hypothetical protein
MNKQDKYPFIGWFFDLLIAIVLVAALYPIAKWYYDAQPPMGLDFYQFPSYVRYLIDHFALPPVSWKNNWFDGVPLITDYSAMFFYLAIPFAKIWGLVFGSKIFLLVMTYGYFFFAYLFIKAVAKNRFFAFAATLALVYSANYYNPLTSGGNATYAATQFFLPLVFWLVAKFYLTEKRKYLFLSIFFAGLSYWGHAGTALIFVWVPALVFLFFWRDKEEKIISFSKLKNSIGYGFVSMLVGFLPLYAIAYLVITIPKAANFNFFQEGGAQIFTAIIGLFASQNLFIYLGLVMLIILTAVRYRRENWRIFSPFMAVFLYIFAFEWLYVIGRNPFAGGIMPPRTYWFFAFVMAGLAAACWNFVFNSNEETEIVVNQKEKLLRILSQFAIIIVFLVSPLCPLLDLNLKIFKTGVAYIGVSTNFKDFATVQSTLGQKALGDSIVNQQIKIDALLSKKDFSEKDLNLIKGVLIPTWLKTDDVQHRLHTLEVGVNIWWSMPFNTPITHGSYNSAHFESNNYTYWTDMAFHGELVTRWNHPLEIAKNDLLFLIDWRGIKYLLGNEVEVKEKTEYSLESSILGPSSIASYLTQNPDYIDRRGMKDESYAGSEGIISSNLDFFRVKENITSPIIKTTNAPTILVIGDPKTAYDNFVRNLGHLNLNSRYLVPVKGDDKLKDLALNEFKKFDVVLLQYYLSDPKVWDILKKYVEEGGKLILETGSEVKESEAKSLPAVFPVNQTTRGSLGNAWDLQFLPDEPLLNQVETGKFGPLLYNSEPWKLSYSEASAVRPWARVVMSQKQKPFLVAGNLGKGQVIWSGLNLSYHFNQYMSLAEGQLIKNILGSMIELKDEGILDFSFERPAPEKITVSGKSFKGVILKENNYGGWSAQMLTPNKKNLTVYNAGLGYVYVPVPKDVSGPISIKIEYKGTMFIWFFFILAVVTSLILIVKAFLPNKTKIDPVKPNLSDKIKGKVGDKLFGWWRADDEQ